MKLDGSKLQSTTQEDAHSIGIDRNAGDTISEYYKKKSCSHIRPFKNNCWPECMRESRGIYIVHIQLYIVQYTSSSNCPKVIITPK